MEDIYSKQNLRNKQTSAGITNTLIKLNMKTLHVESYAHHRREVVLGGGGDLLTGRPDVLDGGVEVAQLGCDDSLVHC